MALGHRDRRKRSRRKEQLCPMAVTQMEHGALQCGFISGWDGWDAGGDQDQLIPWDELCSGLLAPVLPVTSVPWPCGHLLRPCHGDQGQTKLILDLETVPVNREWNWCQAGCPAGSSYPGGKEKAGVCPAPHSQWGQ